MKIANEIQEMIKKYPECWVCGEEADTENHSPPKSLTPKLYVKMPICTDCHRKLNQVEYSKRQERTLRTNVKHIEKSLKNIRNKLLDKESEVA